MLFFATAPPDISPTIRRAFLWSLTHTMYCYKHIIPTRREAWWKIKQLLQFATLFVGNDEEIHEICQLLFVHTMYTYYDILCKYTYACAYSDSIKPRIARDNHLQLAWNQICRWVELITRFNLQHWLLVIDDLPSKVKKTFGRLIQSLVTSI